MLVTGGTTEELRSVLPYCTIIENNSSRSISATATIFGVLLANGTRKTIASITQYNLYPMRPGSISPGGQRLVAPDMTLNSSIRHHRTIGQPEIAAIARVLPLFSGGQLTIELDAVIFDDGEIVGPDSKHNADRFNAWLSADADVLKDLSSRRRQNSSAAVISWLEGLAAADTSPAMANGDYLQRRQAAARAAVNSVSQLGQERCLDVFEESLRAARLPLVHRSGH
jgi:hypothetical protein